MNLPYNSKDDFENKAESVIKWLEHEHIFELQINGGDFP